MIISHETKGLRIQGSQFVSIDIKEDEYSLRAGEPYRMQIWITTERKDVTCSIEEKELPIGSGGYKRIEICIERKGFKIKKADK